MNFCVFQENVVDKVHERHLLEKGPMDEKLHRFPNWRCEKKKFLEKGRRKVLLIIVPPFPGLGQDPSELIGNKYNHYETG